MGKSQLPFPAAYSSRRIPTPNYMDAQTAHFYEVNATDIARRYEGVSSPVERYFPASFLPGAKVLDIGCGSGRDLSRLLAHGYDAYGIEPSASLRTAAFAAHPELAGRIEQGALPETGEPFGGGFDGIVCSAVLMHIPSTDLLDAVLAIRSLLKDRGRILLSLPASRGEELTGNRDAGGRLFSPYSAGEISLLFERFGFHPLGRWESGDQLGRPGTSWYTLLLELQGSGVQRPIDQIETILNRDRKEATYKLALIRALAEIATQEARSAVWLAGDTVGIPLRRIAERWLLYYWPIMASQRLVPQSRAEAADAKPLKFRASLTALVREYAGKGSFGGLSAWHLARTRGGLSAEVTALLNNALRDISGAIRSGPVAFSGGALATGPVFSYDPRTKLVEMPADLWREFSLLGHWIRDAVIVRWAELSGQFGIRQGISAADVLPLLLAQPEADRVTALARASFESAGVKECTWSGKRLSAGFAVDHVIPFSLWANNDLWNLVPTDPKVNLQKSDKLPAHELLIERRMHLTEGWSILRDSLPAPFDAQAEQLLGQPLRATGPWQDLLFTRLREAIETTAMQRGIERWVPASRL